MTITRDMILAGRTFAVPALPLGVNRKVYPICRKLSLKDGLVDRVMAEGLMAALSDDDMGDLADVTFACAHLVDPTLDRDAFEQMPISPTELFDGFISVIRYQTGMWVPAIAAAGDVPGEAAGEASPQRSILIESSPA